jgi:hypothetical protein
LDPVVLLGSACLLGHKCWVGCQKDTKSVSIASKMGHGEEDKEEGKFCWRERQSGKIRSENGDLSQMRNFKKWVIFPLNFKISNLHEK